MHTLAVALLAVLCSITAARFACGNDDIQANFAEFLVQNDCKGKMTPLDRCCKVHSKCYMAGRPQANCDNQFCTCANEVSKGMPSCQPIFLTGVSTAVMAFFIIHRCYANKPHATNFCNTAKAFGGLNYERLKNEGKQMGLH